MKKNKLISLTALILAAIMLLASCNKNKDGEIDPKAAAAAEWAEYIVYDAPETKAEATAEKILSGFKTGTDGNVERSFEYTDDLLITKTTETTTNSDNVQIQNITHKWYSMETGEVVIP